jgi:hypothetical protein
MSTEILLTCPWCKTPNFSERGLKGHVCRSAPGGQRRQLSAPALHMARKAAGLVKAAPTAAPSLPSASPMPKAEPSAAVVVFESAAQQLTKFQAKTVDAIEAVAVGERNNTLRRVAVGIALRIIKRSLPHGQFQSWLKTNVKDAGYRQCAYMMNVADVFVERAALGGSELVAIANGKTQLAPKGKKAPGKLQAFAAEFVGEHTWGELLADLGIKGGEEPAGGGGGKPKKPSPAPSAEELYQQSRDELGGLLTQAENLFITENRLQHLAGHPEEVAGVVQSLRDLAAKVEEAAAPLLKSAKK